ncbi:MAG: MFS transporter, partial [Clostridia bacterium]
MAGLTNIRRALTPRPPPPDIAEGRRSRALYALGEANWVTVDQLSTNTYLAALMLHLGFADGDIGTVMALSALVCVIQLLTLGRGGHYRGKRMVVAITSAQRLWMAFMYFIPFLPVSSTLKMVLLGGIYFLSRAAISFGGPASSEWVAQLTPMRIRGRYLGAKDATSVAVQAVVLLAAGMVLDANKASTPLRSFAILGLMVTGLCVLGFTAYMFTEDRHSPKVDRAAPSESIGAQLARCLGDRSFRIVLTLDCLWQITYYIACPYNASYSIKEMSLSFTFMSVVGFAGNIARIFIARKMGAWADRTSMAKVLRFSILLLGLHYITWTLMRSSVAYWMYILMALLSTTA